MKTDNSEKNPFKNSREYQEEILTSMKRYELLIGELYLSYAEKFPQKV